MNINVKKFSWNPESLEAVCHYSVEIKDGKCEKHTLECSDKPKKELVEAMQALAEPALRECEVIRAANLKERKQWNSLLGDGYMEKNHDPIMAATDQREAFATVRSVSWSWSHEIMGASCCLLVKLEHSHTPLVVNCPHKPEEQYSDSGTAHLLPGSLADAYHELHNLVVGYINGDREPPEQIDMFEEKKETA